MARKKVVKQEEPPKTNSDIADKLANLKTLNDLLVRETIERRDQVDSLLRSNEIFESEIAHYKAENQWLVAEKNQCEERIVVLELDLSLRVVFLSSELEERAERWKKHIENVEKMAMTQKMAMIQKVEVADAELELMKGEKEELIAQIDLFETQIEESVRDKVAQESKTEELQKEVDRLGCDLDTSTNNLNRIASERDGVRKDLDMLKEEANGFLSIAGQLRIERDELVEEKKELEKNLRSLEMRLTVLEGEKDEIEKARIIQDIIMTELQVEVDLLAADLSSNRDDFDCCQKDLDMLKEMANGFQSIAVQLRIERDEMVEEKMELEKNLRSLQKSFDVHSLRLNDLEGEKDEIEKGRTKQDITITELQGEVDLLTADRSSNRDDFDCVLRERQAIQKDLDLHKEEVKGLALKVLQLEESNAMFRDECNGLMEERRERDSALTSLMNEKKSIEVSFVESLQLIEDLERKMKEIVSEKEEVDGFRLKQEAKITELQTGAEELCATVTFLQKSCKDLTEFNHQLQVDLSDRKAAFDLVLCERVAVLKNLDLLKQEEEGLRAKVFDLEKNNAEIQENLLRLSMEFGRGVGVDGEMKEKARSFVAELGAIERAFKDRGGKMEDMNREVEFLKGAIAGAQKKRTLWAWVSSLTTVLAAASIAYATKGHWEP